MCVQGRALLHLRGSCESWRRKAEERQKVERRSESGVLAAIGWRHCGIAWAGGWQSLLGQYCERFTGEIEIIFVSLVFLLLFF